MGQLTPFERRLKTEIEKQVKKVAEAEGTRLYNVEVKILKTLIKAFDQYKAMRKKKNGDNHST